jgi:hypothetical protein
MIRSTIQYVRDGSSISKRGHQYQTNKQHPNSTEAAQHKDTPSF